MPVPKLKRRPVLKVLLTKQMQLFARHQAALKLKLTPIAFQ